MTKTKITKKNIMKKKPKQDTLENSFIIKKKYTNEIGKVFTKTRQGEKEDFLEETAY